MSSARRPDMACEGVAPVGTAFLGGPAGRTVEVIDDAHNRRIKVLGASAEDWPAAEALVHQTAAVADERPTKITVYAHPGDDRAWADRGYRHEATIHGYFASGEDAWLHAAYPDPTRGRDPHQEGHDATASLATSKKPLVTPLPADLALRRATPDDAPRVAPFLRSVFPSYPTSLEDEHVGRLIREALSIFHLVEDAAGDLVACASAEVDRARGNAEITDCATSEAARGRGIMAHVIRSFEHTLPKTEGIRDLYTLARAGEVGMNCAFARAGFRYTGCLINNCRMPSGFESMNVWCRQAPDDMGSKHA